jgi:mannosyl-oligosaccharide alpha-1,2-mannosidase
MLFNRNSLCTAALFAASTFTFTSSVEASSLLHRRDNLAQCASTNTRSEKIKQSFLLAYNGYKKYAWGHDELLPVAKKFSDSR